MTGGALAALLEEDSCWVLEDAFLLILSTTSVNECTLLAVELAGTLDVGSSSGEESSDSFSLTSSLFLDVLLGFSFLFLEEAPLDMLLFDALDG